MSELVTTVGDAWTNEGIPYRQNTNLETLLEVLVEEYHRSLEDLELVRKSSKIGTSTGQSLEKLGNLIGVRRRTDEADASYRARIQSSFRASTTGTTFDDTVQFIASVLDTPVEEIEISDVTTEQEPIITVSVPSNALDEIQLSTNDFVEIVNQVIAASHRVEVVQLGTFRVRSADQPNDSSKGVISEGDTDGGTLASVADE